MNEIDEIVITESRIKEKVKELADRISQDYEGKDLHLVAVLKGALIFLADFARNLTLQTTFDFLVVSNFEDAKSSGEVRLLKDLDHSIQGRHVLLVEDVIDNGRTTHALLSTLHLRQPASLKVCTLFDKPVNRLIKVSPDYLGFSLPDRFVVGYGLDYREKYRNLPYLATLRKEVLSKHLKQQ